MLHKPSGADRSLCPTEAQTACPICSRPVEPGKECTHCVLRAALETSGGADAPDAPQDEAPLPIGGSPAGISPSRAGSSPAARFQHYRLVTHSDGSPCELGRGGMGITYKGFDENLHCYVAIKVVHRHLLHNGQVRERFTREARQAARLRHPNVASILHLGEQEGLCFYAMEYIDGESVEQLIERSGPVTPRFALQVAAEVASALGAAAKLRLVHRDLKPSNLMLLRSDSGEVHVKVIDFGVGLLLEPEAAEDSDRLTMAGLVGTAEFASPEQLRNESVDGRSDIYSLGATLWFMLTGEAPPREPSARFGSMASRLPACVAALIERMLRQDPAARPQTAVALQTNISKCLQQVSVAGIDPRFVHSRPFRRLAPLAWFTAIAALILGASGYALWRGYLARRDNESAASAARAGPHTIAVLPFHPLGSDPENAQLAEAIHDEILSTLALNKQLRVISQGSVLNPRLTLMTPAEKGRTLGASVLMEGSLQRNEKQFRVNARLVEARTGRTVYARSFDGDKSNLFALEQQVAKDMTAQLQPNRPSAPAKNVPTENMAAYEAYLRGAEWERRVENEMGINALKAAEAYEQAVTLDPSFALAEARLASTYARLFWQEDDWKVKEGYLAKAQRAVERAIKLQPDLPEAHAALGYYYYYGHRDYAHALDEFRVAQKSLPNDADVALALGLVLRRKAAWNESLANFTRASQLDPLNARVLTILSDTVGALRRYDEEAQILAREIALAPNDPELRVALGYTTWKKTGSTAKLREAVQLNDPAHDSDSGAFARWDVEMLERKFDDAVRNAQKSPLPKVESESGIFPKELLIGLALWAKGDHNAALPYFEQSKTFMEPAVEKKTEGPRLRVALALAYAGLGRKSEALQQGQLAKDERPTSVDPVGGPPIQLALARVYVMAGENAAAIRELSESIKIPFGVSKSRLGADPAWDPLRGMPEFEALLK